MVFSAKEKYAKKKIDRRMKTFSEWIGANKKKTVEQVAEEFYGYMGGRFKGCELGIAGESEKNPGSGNCAWTARRFMTWLGTVSKRSPGSYGKGQVVLFPHTESEPMAHIVPAYDGKIIDYIQAFTRGQKYVIHPIPDASRGMHELPGGDPYRKWYQSYFVADSISEIDSYHADRYKQPISNVRIRSFDRPRRLSRDSLQPWQTGQE